MVKYLGVPLFLSNNRVKDFSYVKERLESRTSGWKCKSLSWMGRATMIKLVAQSIPIYPMAAFQLPKRLCEDMDSVVRKFWWNPKKDASNYFSPKAWKVLCRPLKEGGLGFRSFYNINAAMLAKLAWWVLSGKDILCVKVLLAKYKVGKNWLKAPPIKSASWTWRSLERVKTYFVEWLLQACWRWGQHFSLG